MATGPARPFATGRPRPPAAADLPAPTVLEGVAGFRDLGGLPTASGGATRHRVLFRSPCPSELTARDREVLAALGLAVRIDLRAAFERRDAPPVHLSELACAPLPVLDAPDAARYVRRLRGLLGDRRDPAAVLIAFLRADGAAFARVFQVLAERTPALVHCTTGRDRTGLVAALALRLAGVSDGFIALDYAESRAEGVSGDGEPILRALQVIDDDWGGAAAYLQAHGCPVERLDAFRRAFVA